LCRLCNRREADHTSTRQRCPRDPEAAAAFADSIAHLAADADVHVIVRGMKTHALSQRVQEKACKALAHLADSDPRHQVAIAAVGGIERIVRAMMVHEASAGVQEKASRALINLAFKHDKNKTAIASGGGIERVVVAMSLHVENRRVQEAACGVLGNLAVDEDNRDHIAAAGGVERVLEAMRAHAGQPGLQEQACGALMNIGWSNRHFYTVRQRGLQERIRAAGGEELIRAACEAPAATKATAHNGQKLLEWLARF